MTMRMKSAMRCFALLLFLLLGAGVHAQTTADVDTFMVNSSVFVVTTPTDWFSTSVNSGIQEDTTWNYKMRYSPKENPKNTYAEIWIHIINNSTTTATKKQQKEFKKNCTVTQSKLGTWSCSLLNYKGKKLKDCKKCGLLYTQVYVVPLNEKQSLEILFLGQGAWPEIYQQEIKFGQFATGFVKYNHPGMSRFRIIDFFQIARHDTFTVGEYSLSAYVPDGFSSSSDVFISAPVRGHAIPTYATGTDGLLLNNPDAGISIHISGTSRTNADSAVSLPAVDTTITVRSYGKGYGAYYVPPTTAWLSTSRQISSTANQDIVVTFKMKIPVVDAVMLEYYKQLLRDYANLFVRDNVSATKNLKKLELPSLQLNEKKINPPVQPIKFDKIDQGLPKPK